MYWNFIFSSIYSARVRNSKQKYGNLKQAEKYLHLRLYMIELFISVAVMGCYMRLILIMEKEFGNSRPRVRSIPIRQIDHDRIFFGSRDGYYYALNYKNGSLVWKFKTGG
jgi:hypothetical protein